MFKRETFGERKLKRIMNSIGAYHFEIPNITEEEMKFYFTTPDKMTNDRREEIGRIIMNEKDRLAVKNEYYVEEYLDHATVTAKIIELMECAESKSKFAKYLTVSPISLSKFIKDEDAVNEITRHTIILKMSRHKQGQLRIPSFTLEDFTEFMHVFRGAVNANKLDKFASIYALPISSIRDLHSGKIDVLHSRRLRFQFSRAMSTELHDNYKNLFDRLFSKEDVGIIPRAYRELYLSDQSNSQNDIRKQTRNIRFDS